MDVKAVLFDMDGVIVDSERYWHEEEQTILARAVPGADVALDEITGMNVLDQYDYLEETYGVAVSKEDYFNLYDSRADRIYGDRVTLMDSFHEMLEEARERDVKTAVVSSSFRRWIRLVMDRFDLHDCFDAVVSAEDIDGPSKPDPHIYRHAAAELGVAPERCVVVEDSRNGVKAANAADMYCIGFDSGADIAEADAVAATPSELRERLDALLTGADAA